MNSGNVSLRQINTNVSARRGQRKKCGMVLIQIKIANPLGCFYDALSCGGKIGEAPQ
jgi:hypothetical protein